MAYAFCLLYKQGSRHTLRICNTYSPCTSVMVIRTRINVTFIGTSPLTFLSLPSLPRLINSFCHLTSHFLTHIHKISQFHVGLTRSFLHLLCHFLSLASFLYPFLQILSGPGSVAVIATGYVLDGPGIESRWRRDFPHLSTPALGPTQPPVQ